VQADARSDSRLEPKFLQVPVSVNSVKSIVVTIYMHSSRMKIITAVRTYIYRACRKYGRLLTETGYWRDGKQTFHKSRRLLEADILVQ